MKMQRKWRRSWKRGKPHWAINKNWQRKKITKLQHKRSPFVKGLVKRIGSVAASVALFGLLGMQQPIVMANAIVLDEKTATTITVDGKITDIHTTTYSAGNKIGFNSFSRFNIDTGNTVNLHLRVDASSLINLVNDTDPSTIYGTLNSIKNGAIGGNVYFLNPHGLLVGSSGVVNVGSFTVLAPTKTFMNTFSPTDGETVISGSVPLDSSGLITVQGKINAIGDIKLVAQKVDHSGSLYTGAYFTATSPAFNDVVNINSLANGTKYEIEGGNIKIVAKNINMTTSAKVIAKGYAGKNDGNITLVANNTDGLLDDNGIHIQAASISLDGATLHGKDISLTSSTSYTDIEHQGIARNKSSAIIDVKDSTIEVSGNVKLDANVDVTINARTASFAAKQTGDSAYAGAELDSTARVKLSGTTAINAAGDVSLTAKNTVNLNISAKATDNQGESGESNGGNEVGGSSLGFVKLRSTTEAGVGGAAVVSGANIAINAISKNTVTTDVVASIKGAKAKEAGETSEANKKLDKYQYDAQTSEGNIDKVAALAIHDVVNSTKAYLDSTSLTHSTGQAVVTSKSVNQSTITATGGTVEADASGVGVAVGINKVSSDNRALVNQKVVAKSVIVEALQNGTDANSLTTTVTSGAGNNDVGVAGALAVNVHVNESTAQVGGLANIITDKLAITAKNDSKSIASALPTTGQSGEIGVGASIATNIGINHVIAEIASAHDESTGITILEAVELTAIGKHSLDTTAKAGAKGGIAATPVVPLQLLTT